MWLAALLASDIALAARDAAMLALLVGLGLRRAEAVALELCDYDPTAGMLRIRHGKGDKERRAYLNPTVAAALEAWLVVRGDWPGPLLIPIQVPGLVMQKRLPTRGLNLMLRKRAQQAGVTHMTPHDLRRSFISMLLEAEVDVLTVARLAGHAHVQTTRLYDRRGAKAEQATMQRLAIPYRAPGVGEGTVV